MTTTTKPMTEVALDDHLLTAGEVAQITRITTGTLANWRLKNAGPPYLRIGGAIRYGKRDISIWLRKGRVQTR